MNKILIKFFQWLYFSDSGYEIVKIKSLNTFICCKTFKMGNYESFKI